MWFFGKDKNKNKHKADTPSAPAARPQPAAAGSSKEARQQALLAQMRTLRAEIGEDTLQEIVRKMKLDDLKKQVRHDIDHDERKRDRLLDELRMQMRDDDGKPRR